MFSKKEVKVLLKWQAKTTYETLEKTKTKEAKILLNSINRAISILKENPQFGQPISKQLIPQIYQNQGIQNLYRVEL